MRFRLRLRLAVLWLALPVTAAAHDYYTQTFQIIHPWTQSAPAGTASLGLYMRIVGVMADDRLLSASTGVAERIEVRPSMALGVAAPASAASTPAGTPGIAIARGREVSMSPFSAHLMLRGVKTELHEGREYPLMLVFERAGEVPVEFVVGAH